MEPARDRREPAEALGAAERDEAADATTGDVPIPARRGLAPAAPEEMARARAEQAAPRRIAAAALAFGAALALAFVAGQASLSPLAPAEPRREARAGAEAAPAPMRLEIAHAAATTCDPGDGFLTTSASPTRRDTPHRDRGQHRLRRGLAR